MTQSFSSHEPVLAEARSLLLRRETAAARAILTDLVRRDPDCTEAIQLLLSVDQVQHRQRMAKSSDSYNTELGAGWLPTKSVNEIWALLMGAFFLVAGVCGFYWFFRVGWQGEVPRGSVPTRFVHNGRDALIYAFGAVIFGAGAFWYSIRQLRLK